MTLAGVCAHNTLCLVWYGGPDGALVPSKDQKWGWPILLPELLGVIFKKDPLEANRSRVWFVGTHHTWPFAESREAMRESFGEEQFIAIHVMGGLVPVGLVQVVEHGKLIKPINFIDTPHFMDFVDRGAEERRRLAVEKLIG